MNTTRKKYKVQSYIQVVSSSLLPYREEVGLSPGLVSGLKAVLNILNILIM